MGCMMPLRPIRWAVPLALTLSGLMFTLHISAAQTPAPVARTAIVGGTVVDGNGGPPIADAVILIEGARVAAVGPRSAIPIPADARQIDAHGQWIVPGLIDTNVHLSLYGGQNDRYETLVRYQPREAVTRQHFQQPGPRQTSPGSSQAEPSRQAPIQQRSQPSQPRQQTQAPQPRTEQPVQRTQPTQQAQPEQPRQSVQREPPRQSVQQSQQPASPAQVHRAPQGKGQETDKHAPQGQGGESKPSPQGKGKGQENAPQGKGQENKAAAHGKGEESKKDERDQGRQ